MRKKKTTEEKDKQTPSQNTDNGDVTKDDAEKQSTVSPDAEQKTTASEEEEKGAEKTDAVSDIEKKLSLMNDKYLRLLAEYDNYRKRSVREVEEAHHIATVNLIQELLPILDNLDRATEHRDDKTTLEEYVKGISLIEDQLREALAKAGLKHIEVVGQPFDPHFHEAIMQMESEEYDSGIVSQEVQKGFMLGDRVIRHSKVIVAK